MIKNRKHKKYPLIIIISLLLFSPVIYKVLINITFDIQGAAALIMIGIPVFLLIDTINSMYNIFYLKRNDKIVCFPFRNYITVILRIIEIIFIVIYTYIFFWAKLYEGPNYFTYIFYGVMFYHYVLCERFHIWFSDSVYLNTNIIKYEDIVVIKDKVESMYIEIKPEAKGPDYFIIGGFKKSIQKYYGELKEKLTGVAFLDYQK